MTLIPFPYPSSPLVLVGHADHSNPIFQSYADTIISRCGSGRILNYRKRIIQAGIFQCEKEIMTTVESLKSSHIFLIFTGWDFGLSLGFLGKISSKKQLVLFNFDTEYYFENIDRYYGQVASLVVLPDTVCENSYKELDINCYISGPLYSSKIYRNLHIEKDIDVSFVGNIDVGNRRQYCDLLKSRGINVQVFGAGTDTGPISIDQVVNLYNRSRIVLCPSGTYDLLKMPPGIPKIRQRIKQAKGRPVEVALCGAFVLAEDTPGIRNLFNTEKHIGVFKDPYDLLKKVQFYIEHTELREKMALEAQEWALSNYDLDSGFDKLFRNLGVLNESRQEVYIDRCFEREQAFQYFKYLIHHLRAFNISAAAQDLRRILRYKGFPLSRLVDEVNLQLRKRFVGRPRRI